MSSTRWGLRCLMTLKRHDLCPTCTKPKVAHPHPLRHIAAETAISPVLAMSPRPHQLYRDEARHSLAEPSRATILSAILVTWASSLHDRLPEPVAGRDQAAAGVGSDLVGFLSVGSPRWTLQVDLMRRVARFERR